MSNLFELTAKLALDSTSFTKGIADAKTKFQELGSQSKTFSQKMSMVGDGMKKVGAAMTKSITLPIAGALTAGTKKALDFENGMAKVYTIADKTKVPMDQMRDALLKLSNQSGRSTGELTEGMYQALSASVDTSKSVEFLTTAVNLSKAGFVETSGAVDVLTTIMNAYNKSADEAGNISDQLVQVQNDGKTTVNELASSMGAVIPTAAALNIPLEQLNASYALLTKQGINTASSTTYLSGMFTELSKEGTDVSNILKEKTGKSFGELMASGMSLGDILKILMDSVGGNSEQFSNLWGNVRAGRGALALVNSGVDTFNQETQRMQESSGNVSKALDTLNTPSAKLRKSFNHLSNTLLELGERLAPYVEKFATWLENLMQKWDGLSEKQKDFAIKVALVVAAIGPVLSILGTLVGVINGVVVACGALGIGLAPFLAGGAIIAGIIAGVVLLVKNWDTVTEKAKKVKEGVSKSWGELKSSTKKTVDEMSTKWNSFKENTVKKAGELATGARQKWEELKANTHTVFDNVRQSIQDKLATARDRARDRFSDIKGFAKFTWNLPKLGMEAVTSIPEKVRGIVRRIKELFNFKISFPHIKLPHFNWHWENIGGVLSLPKFDGIDWYRKGYTNPVLFKSPTVLATGSGYKGFGDGVGGEMVYSRNKLLQDIRQASGKGDLNVEMNIYGSDGQDIEELAQIVIDKLTFIYNRQESVFA